MKVEQFFRQVQAIIRVIQLDFRRITYTSQLKLYGEYRYTRDYGQHWKIGRIATARQFAGEAPVVGVREIYNGPQSARQTQHLTVTQKDIETRIVIIKHLTLLQKLCFLDRRRVRRISSLWLDDIYRVKVNSAKKWKTSTVLLVSTCWDQFAIMKYLDETPFVQSQLWFNQYDLDTGRVILRPRTIRERLKRLPIEQWPTAPGSLYTYIELSEQEDLE